MNNNNRISLKVKNIINLSTSFTRDVPNFLIVGTSFCGKTLLYNYLTQNKSICNNLREETGFYANNSSRGFLWYKSNFPTKWYRKFKHVKNGEKILVGETVNLLGTFVPEKISKILKEPKIIVILRNPVDRAYSRYLAMKRAGYETSQFHEAIENENRKIVNDEKKLLEQKVWPPYDYKSPFYRLSGIYADYIIRWNEIFPIEKMLFLSSEELFQNPLKTANKCFDFLGITRLNTIKKIGINYEKDAPKIDKKTRYELVEYFRVHNKRLYTLLGKQFDWDK